MTKIDLVREFFALICRFSSDREEFLRWVLPTAQWIEYPNAINPAIRIRDLEATLQGAAAGRRLLSRQNIAIRHWFESGDELLVEGDWEGEVGIDAGKFRAGQVLKAHMAIVFTFHEGKIARQANYDCYEAV